MFSANEVNIPSDCIGFDNVYYNFFENDKNKDFINKDKKFFENLKISFDSILTKDNKSFDKIIDRNLDLLNFQLAEFKCFNI